MFLLILAAAAQQPAYKMPDNLDACVSAANARSVEAFELCDTSGEKVKLWGGGPSDYPPCLEAMNRAKKFVEASRADVPASLRQTYRKRFDDALSQCRAPTPEPKPAAPVRKTTKLWD